ncbi:MAG: hypothetical protein J5J06_15965 [Phycisphaerae bacterium]|nr:hypothetical protein [Phycisphaerae bacterium]
METRQPVRVFRAGQVTCAIWENGTYGSSTAERTLKVTVAKRYRDRYGYWKQSFRFSPSETLLAIDVLRRAFEAMVDMQIDHEIARAIEAKTTEPLRLGVKRSAA